MEASLFYTLGISIAFRKLAAYSSYIIRLEIRTLRSKKKKKIMNSHQDSSIFCTEKSGIC